MSSRSLLLLMLILSLLFSSCLTLKKRSTKGIEQDYESFFINDSTTQYFIKPLDFNGNDLFSCDFTFRKSGSAYSEITMNYTCINQDNHQPDTIYLVTESHHYLIAHNKLLFKERTEKNFQFRYSTNISFDQLKDFLTAPSPKVLIDRQPYQPRPSTRKKMSRIKTYLLEFELK